MSVGYFAYEDIVDKVDYAAFYKGMLLISIPS